MPRYRVEAIVEVEVDAKNETAAHDKAYLEITFGTDVNVIQWGAIDEIQEE